MSWWRWSSIGDRELDAQLGSCQLQCREFLRIILAHNSRVEPPTQGLHVRRAAIRSEGLPSRLPRGDLEAPPLQTMMSLGCTLTTALAWSDAPHSTPSSKIQFFQKTNVHFCDSKTGALNTGEHLHNTSALYSHAWNPRCFRLQPTLVCSATSFSCRDCR